MRNQTFYRYFYVQNKTVLGFVLVPKIVSTYYLDFILISFYHSFIPIIVPNNIID